ncbi:transglutaminase family protein [Allosphingosinicella indica]|uniref:Transglutaminase-like enzyme, putative cysteine protease n=1 Tax=Allosphingosinicella indica TaxID=941907 RepID=A0A1X7G638_9SPHN|nr:transglutaminase family protein [Allosphingosinicella indica]SMF64094.1 Transglutaminase-like enzyme, putative cysteine protease [Allosphingosinicella indica]
MRLAVQYDTRYRYDTPPKRVVQLMRVTPLSFSSQNVLEWRIDVDCDARLREHRDGYGNIVHMLYVDAEIDHLAVTVSGRVLTEDSAGVIAGLPHDLPPAVFLRETALTHPSAGIRGLAHALEAKGGPTLDRLHRLNAALHERLTFDTDNTDPGTTATEAFDAGHGVCQDFAHIFIAVARTMGIPARYISGHLFRRDGAVHQPAAHAWTEAWIDGLGWTAFDPTNGISADDAYIRVAGGLDYREAAPFVGSRNGGGGESLAVEVEVRLARAQAQAQTQS